LIINGNFLYAMLFSSLAGALLGFLRYNFNPASVFMGDGGSYFLGYTIAGLAIGNIDVAEYAHKNPLLKLEMPLVDAAGERTMGILWLVKDLKRDQITHYTLGRVEHLRRAIVGVLGKMEGDV
jgi:UDP-N-acetylmuramyl pentapeptide phosphotransferase/UDP-N-acetylglucosamine-1-phosphate transferase